MKILSIMNTNSSIIELTILFGIVITDKCSKSFGSIKPFKIINKNRNVRSILNPYKFQDIKSYYNIGILKK